MAITFTSNPAAESTFADLFTDDSGATWYQLWTGNGDEGNFVDTSAFNDEGKGWISAADLAELDIDFAQSGDTTLWVKAWDSTNGSQDWISGDVDFDAVAGDDITETTSGNAPLSSMFNVEDVSEGTWFQIWNGNEAGTNGAYLITDEGKGWVQAEDLDDYFYQATAFAGNQSWMDNFGADGGDELWVRTWTSDTDYGWEHWTVDSSVQGNIEGVDLGGNVTGLSLDTEGGTTTLVGSNVVIDGDGSADVLRLTGDADIRIDLTDPADQVEEIDLNGDGVIAFDGIENDLSGAGILTVSNFEVFDAYARNPKNYDDHENNFFGDIEFDGTGFAGDGVSTDGNIFLGGLGSDTAFGGIGNDFMAGGGSVSGADTLYGGRNADFFFVELSALDSTDGNALNIDGGSTWDSSSTQDSDWLLLEASDDDEPVSITLNDGALDGVSEVVTRSGVGVDIHEVENLDASGNLYGFLNDYDVVLGDAAEYDGTHDADGSENSGLGSSAQLIINGSNSDNIIIAGYDNDTISGSGGDDILMGGNLSYLLANANNPNLLDADGGLDLNLNLVGVVNDGSDIINGDAGDDEIVFEMDGGTITGGANTDGTAESTGDTLWLTDFSMGRVEGATAEDEDTAQAEAMELMTDDSVIRIDLGAVDGYQGYGGADELDTIDQTNYVDALTVVVDGEEVDTARVDASTIENVNASGLGNIDYEADGGNSSEVSFNNQANYYGIDVDLDLRGTDDDTLIRVATEIDTIDDEVDLIREGEYLYANTGDDVLEGRGGDDLLMGGEGDDDFYFSLNDGDNVDVIHRLGSLVDEDGNATNIWDGTYGQDFGLDSTTDVGSSNLVITILDPNDPGAELGDIVEGVGGVDSVVTAEDGTLMAFSLESDDISSAQTYQELTDALNDAIDALENLDLAENLSATLTTDDNDNEIILITDALGRDMADTAATGGVVYVSLEDQTSYADLTFADSVDTVSQDRLIFKAYEDRIDNEGVDDDSVTGSTISLGEDAYAEDLVVSFSEDGTRIAEDQQYEIDFTNLAVEDVVTVNINGVLFSAQVGVAPDETLIPGESTAAFIARFANEINSFLDNDTAAGQVAAAFGGLVDGTVNSGILTLTQVAYNGEETVFMSEPVVTVENLSGGETAVVDVTNISQSEVLLLDFDGQDGNLNSDNVLFWGEEEVNRSVLQTAEDAGGDLYGSDTVVINVAQGDEIDSSAEEGLDGAEISYNEEANIATGFGVNFTVHGDDQLFGGSGDDDIYAGTGDDRVYGSAGEDTIDGGKDIYLQDGEIRVYNDYEAAQADADPDVISLEQIFDTEDGATLSNANFDDTLIFQQGDFGVVGADGVNFTITLDNYDEEDGEILLTDGGAGTVENSGDVDDVTVFTNFENVRTVSGDGTLAGQGNDTLDISALSTDTGGIRYNLTGDDLLSAQGGDAGQIQYDAETEAFDPDDVDADGDLAERDWTDFFQVDGVEHVITGDGEDTLLIDETEAGKHNTFEAGLGDDSIVYYSDFADGDEATVTLTVNAESDTDTLMMTSGSLGLDEAVDTLESVETIRLAEIADSDREDDVLDVTNVTDAVIDFVNEEIRSNGDMVDDEPGQASVSDDEVLNVVNMSELEYVVADGEDTVIVADNMVNSREDVADGTAATDILFDSYLTYDTIDETVDAAIDDDDTLDRLSVADMRANGLEANIADVVNDGLYTFSLGAETDRVDYSDETGTIATVVDVTGATTTQNVIVDNNGDEDLTDAGDRIDILENVEEIVAASNVAGNDSILDFTASTQDVEITFQYNGVDGMTTSRDLLENTVRIADGDSNSIDGVPAFVEYYDLDDDDDVAAFSNATWNRVEGSDNAETVIYEGSEDLVDEAGLDHRYSDDELVLRGGENNVVYHALETSITAQIEIVEDTGSGDGLITTTVNFQDGDLGALAGAGTHTITSYTSDNSIAAGTLKIEASQDAEDIVEFTSTSDKVFILGSSPGVLDVQIGDLDAMRLTGFEFIADADTDDIYQFVDLTTGMEFIDSAVDDYDTIIVNDDAVGDGNAPADTISLEVLNDDLAFDFDVLDITMVTEDNLILVGDTDLTRDRNDDLIVGDLDLIDDIQVFDTLWLTDASVVGGNDSFILDLDNAEFQDENGDAYFDYDGNGVNLSLITDTDLEIAAVDTAGVGVTLVGADGDDVITGDAGDDFLIGGAGDDVIAGGVDEVNNVFTVELGGSATGGGTVTVFGQTVATIADDDADNIGGLFAALDLDDFVTGAGDVPISFNYDDDTNELTFVFDSDVSGTIVPADVATTDPTFDLGAPFETIAYVLEGAGDDIIAGGLGVDDISGGAGNDTFVVIGALEEGDYNNFNTFGTAARTLGLEDVLVNAKVESDVSTDTYDGGDGVDIFEIWGDANFTEAEFDNMEGAAIHSDVTGNLADFAGMNVWLADADSQLTLVDALGNETVLDADSVEADYDAAGVGYAATEEDLYDFNTAPVAVNDTDEFTVLQGESVIIDVADLLLNDSDVDLDALTIVSVAQLGTADGEAVLSVVDQTITFTAAADYEGAASFTYTISDGTDTATAVVTGEVVAEINLDPVAVADAYVDVEINVATNLDVLANDTDADAGDVVALDDTNAIVVTGPDGATATAEYDMVEGDINFTADTAGDYTFTYDITDGNGGVDSAEVTVTVIAENIIDLVEGTTAPVAATADAEIFSFDAVSALAMTDNTQIQITGFDIAADSLLLDIETAGGVDSLDDLNGVDGIAVQTNAITNLTTINFGNDADGDVVAIQIAGVTDASLIMVEAV